jgi:hypothetical protein
MSPHVDASGVDYGACHRGGTASNLQQNVTDWMDHGCK